MPIYEYECRNKHRFERFATIDECDKSVVCPACRSAHIGNSVVAYRIVSRTGTPVFKRGSGGFYSPNKD